MKILITGGAGFIGSHLSHFHIDKGDTVYIIDNLITGSKDNIQDLLHKSSFHFVEEDVTTIDFSVFPTFDIVYHLASPASPIQYKKYPIVTLMTNGYGTFRLLEFVQRSESKAFVMASTSEVYGDPLVHPQVEEYFGNVNSVGPRACYDEGKRYAEAMTMTFFRSYGINTRIARIFNTYGPNMEKNDGRVVSNFIMQSLTGKPITIYGDGKQTRSFCYVSDLVRGLNLLATTPAIEGSIINLGNPDERSMTELASIIKDMTGSESVIKYEAIDADDPRKRKPDITKAKKMLDWNPKISLDLGLDQTISYFRKKFI
ncbi:MAG: hypothetical protein RI947_1306 [Candidatus Parcubacteria bacterium]|jgi:dTDP-glucose 4,6-dehydratase/UDP-glucuronate decarboxylase